MLALINVILPVFFVIGFGYWAVWKGYFTNEGVDGLMSFTQHFAIPCLLFRAISTLDLSASFDFRLLGTYYISAFSIFCLGTFGARYLFNRPWEHCVAIGFCALFSNTVLLGLPIVERAYGTSTLDHMYTIIAFHAPFCYTLGIVSIEAVKSKGGPLRLFLPKVGRAVFRNALIVALALGFTVNLTGLDLPHPLTEAVDLMVRAALPAALFGLGGVLYQYKPEGDSGPIALVVFLSLIGLPALVWLIGAQFGLDRDQIRVAVMTGAMAPGINTYVFASIYGVAKRVAATSILLGTAFSMLTLWMWLAILP